MLGFYTFQGLGSSQLADHLVNEINQGPCYVKVIEAFSFPTFENEFTTYTSSIQFSVSLC